MSLTKKKNRFNPLAFSLISMKKLDSEGNPKICPMEVPFGGKIYKKIKEDSIRCWYKIKK